MTANYLAAAVAAALFSTSAFAQDAAVRSEHDVMNGIYEKIAASQAQASAAVIDQAEERVASSAEQEDELTVLASARTGAQSAE